MIETRDKVSIVEDVIREMDDWGGEASWIYKPDMKMDKKIVVLKSTVPPGTTERLNKDYENIDIIFNSRSHNYSTTNIIAQIIKERTE